MLSDDVFVSQRAGRAGDHAFPARNTGRTAHRIVEIESDAGLISFVLSSDHVVVPHLTTCADAAVAEDASGVVNEDAEGGIVLRPRLFALRITRFSDSKLIGETL